MYALLTLLSVVTLALLFARVATQAFIHTGLSESTARFQAWSALSGVGYTTREAESLVNHPVRRHLLMWLMLVGNAGIITVVSSLILTFMNTAEHGLGVFSKLGVLFGGLALLWALGSSAWIDRMLKRLIDRALDRYTHIGVQDFESLVELSGSYRVSELYIQEGDWLSGRSLRESGLRNEGLNVLGIRRQTGEYEGEMTPTTLILPGDAIVVYGRLCNIEAIDRRKRGGEGDREHRRAIEAREQVLQEIRGEGEVG
ncbi:MAG: TrkA C-terminal domain-containing protein [Planctomycetota bacterium]